MQEQSGTKLELIHRRFPRGCHWRTEHRHDAVAGELVDRAAELLHNCGAAVDQLGHHLAQSLRTHRRGDVHGVDHIGEQDGDLLVLGRCRRGRNRCTAMVAELRVRRQLCTATRIPRLPLSCHAASPLSFTSVEPGSTAPGSGAAWTVTVVVEGNEGAATGVPNLMRPGGSEHWT